MSTERAAGAIGPFEVECGLTGHSAIDYDRRRMRKALREGAKVVIKEARRLVSRSAISGAGGFPGEQSGRLRRAIGVVRTGSKGGWVKVGVRSIKGSIFYPAFLFYGSPKTGLQKRGNYITAAAETKREGVRGMVQASLANSLVPR